MIVESLLPLKICNSLPETTAIVSKVNNIAPELGGLLNHGIAINPDSLDCP